MRVAARSLLTLEGFGHADRDPRRGDLRAAHRRLAPPAGTSFTLSTRSSADGDLASALVTAATVFGFLSFAGFEGAAALGEETDEPGRNIPRALFLAPFIVGVFY